jgi:hypothetical protein
MADVENTTPSARRRLVSAWYVVTGGVIAATIAVSASGAGDPDLFWHRILGGIWLDRLSVRLPDRDPLAYTEGRPWLPTAWFMEVVYDRVVAVAGYQGIEVLRLVLTLVFVGLLVTFVHRRLTPERAAAALLLVAVPAAFDIQDRPQTVSFILAAAALPSIHRWLEDRSLPAVPAIAVFTWVWANVHALWLLVPALLVIAFVGDPSRSALRAVTIRLGAAVLGACLTPVGPELLVIPFRVRGSTSLITEWEPTALQLPFTWGLAGSLILILVGWARATRRVETHRIVYVVAITVFSMMAYRNVTVSTILLLPVITDVIAGLWAGKRSGTTLPRALVATMCGLLALSGGVTYLREPVVQHQFPARIAQRLADEPGPVRVLNDYNISGYLREFGGANVRLAIDGRADRYGDETIRRFTDLTNIGPGWRRTFREYDPDLVVIERVSALRQMLIADGWTIEMSDGRYVLLDPPQ